MDLYDTSLKVNRPVVHFYSYLYIIDTPRLLIGDFVCFRNPMLPFGPYPKVLFASIKKLVGSDHAGEDKALRGSAEFKLQLSEFGDHRPVDFG